MGSCTHRGSGKDTGNRKGRCVWQGVVLSRRGVQSLPVAGLRVVLRDVLLGVCMGMNSGTGSRGVDRGIVHNARDTRDVHSQGSRQHRLVMKTKYTVISKTLTHTFVSSVQQIVL